MTNARRQRIYLTCQVAGWTVHGLINMGFALTSSPMNVRLIVALVWAESLAAFSSHLLRAWIHRHGWLQLSLRRVAPRVFLGSLACGAGVTLVTSTTSVLVFHLNREPDWNWIYVIPIFFVWSVVVFLWAVIYFGVHYFEGYQDARLEQLRLAVAVKDSELRALLSQVNPHFIFNCLNSLRALISEDPPRAQSMVDELAGILRYSLKSGRVETVALEDELAAIRAYLKLELIRFEDRLRVSMDIDPATLDALVPPMLVQTLVENGVKHGVSRLAQGGEIRVVSRIGRDALTIQVVNSGQLAPSAEGATRIGMENARERLRILYGSAATLVLRNLDAGSVLAELSLPLRRTPA